MPDVLTSHAVGLFTVRERQTIPLAAVAVEAQISIAGARVTLTQRYVNREDVPVEAVYVFPIDEPRCS